MLTFRELLNVTHAAFTVMLGAEKVEEALTPASEAEPEPVKVVAQNREWLASLRAAGVPLPKVPGV